MGNKNTREAMKDPDYDGQDFTSDPELRNGPMINRKCTDVLFWLLFVISLGMYGFTSIYGWKNGKPKELFTPVDGDGKFCGIGDRADYPYLYYMVLPSAMMDPRAVCVKSCPSEIVDPLECKDTSRITPADCAKEQSKDKSGHVGYGTNSVLKRFCVPDVDKMPDGFKALDNIVGSFGLDDVQEYMEDIGEASNLYIYTFFTCILVTIIYSFLIYYFTGLIVWAAIIGTGAGLVFLSMWLQVYHNTNFTTKSIEAKTDADKQKVRKGQYIQATVYGLYGVICLYVIALCCLFKDISVSIGVLKTSAIIVVRNLRILFMPMCQGIFLVLWISVWVVNFSYLVSTGDIKQPKKGSQLKEITLEPNAKKMAWFQVFMFFWVFEFIQAMFNFVIIVAVCTWYFSSTNDTRGDFSLSSGFWWAVRYNGGSLALGSFILAIIWMIRVLFEYVDSTLKRSESEAAKFVTNCIRYCLDCFHRFIKFLNDNAYIQIALTGENFCSSAMSAFVLALKNAGSFLITNGIGSIIHLIGKAAICVSNVFLGFFMLRFFPEFETGLGSPIGPLAMVGIMSFLLANIFIGVFSITSLTVLQCLYTDVDICNQNKEDPLNNANRPIEMEGIVAMIKK